MDIHENDIGQEKRVFLVTLPTHNIENLQICVGNAYDDGPDKVRYNIYNVDKKTKKVSSTLGYYEFPKETKVIDGEGDFNVLDLGEASMHIQNIKPLPVQIKVKAQVKAKAKAKAKMNEYVVPDDDYLMRDYFEGNYKLTDDEIIPTFLAHMRIAENWANDLVVDAVARFYNIYIILVVGDINTNNVNRVIVQPFASEPYVVRKYIIIDYEPHRHYRIVEDENKKMQFDLDELPTFLTDQFPEGYKKQISGPNVVEPKYNKIKTTGNGDCFWDSVNRAVTGIDDYDQATVTKMRNTVAEFIEKGGNENSQYIAKAIITAYELYTTKNTDVVYDIIFPIPTKENRELFDHAYEYLFTKRDKITHELLPHVKNAREFSNEKQTDLIREYLRTHDKDGNEIPEPAAPEPAAPESAAPEPAALGPAAPDPAEPAPEPVSDPAATDPVAAPVDGLHTQDTLIKLTVPVLKEILLSLPGRPGRQPLGAKKQEIIDCILDEQKCKPVKEPKAVKPTKKNGGRVSSHYTRKL